MIIRNTLAQRDAYKGPILMWQLKLDGKWYGYQTQEEMPVFPNPPAARVISSEAFRDKFTQEEIAAIYNLGFVVGDAGLGLLLIRLFTATDGIDLNSTDVINGLTYLVSKTIITSARKDEILA